MVGDFDNHIWVGGRISDDRFRRNLLPYAKRHGFALVFTEYTMDTEAAGEQSRPYLEATEEWGVDAWLATGIIPGGRAATDWELEYTDRELLEDEAKMERFLEPQRRTAETYAEYYPEGKLMLWHEDPIMGNWTGETYQEKAQSMAEHGPEIFARQFEAVRKVAPDCEVGIFPHDDVMATPDLSTSSIAAPLFAGLKDRNALPDFTYNDLYRGYREPDAGYEATNEVLENILTNIREHTEGRPVYQLGEAHTINPAYTPSKQSILGDFQTAVDAGVDGVGWWVRAHYLPTNEHCFNPFVPNEGTVADGAAFNSYTGSRDRMLWASQLLVEERADFDPAGAFDLWLYGHDFEFYEHAVSLRTADGEWEFVGDVSGYVDGDNPYSGGGRDRVHALRALDRERFFTEGELAVRIESDGDGTLHSVHAVPYFDTGVFRTEPELTDIVESGGLGPYVLGGSRESVSLSGGAVHTATFGVEAADRPPAKLVYPDQYDTYEARTSAAGSIRERFDLWVYGRGLDDLSVSLAVGHGDDSETRSVDDHADPQPHSAFGGETVAVVFRDLDRDLLTPVTGGRRLDLTLGGAGELLGLYVMPAGGARNFTPDPEVAATVETDYHERAGQIENFALGRLAWPGGRSFPLETRVHVPHRRAIWRTDAE